MCEGNDEIQGNDAAAQDSMLGMFTTAFETKTTVPATPSADTATTRSAAFRQEFCPNAKATQKLRTNLLALADKVSKL